MRFPSFVRINIVKGTFLSALVLVVSGHPTLYSTVLVAQCNSNVLNSVMYTGTVC
jgi:hypothetical protein